MKDPLKVFDDLPNNYAQTNIAFSPDEQLFITGMSVEKYGPTGGMLSFFDRGKLELVSRVGISPTYSVVQCAWHSRLNQVVSDYSNLANIPSYHLITIHVVVTALHIMKWEYIFYNHAVMCFLKPASCKNLHPRNESKVICSFRNSFLRAPISPTLCF